MMARDEKRRWRSCTRCCCGPPVMRLRGAGPGCRSPARNWRIWPIRRQGTRYWRSRRRSGSSGAKAGSTWAYKFVIFEVSAKVARHFWRHPTRSLDAESWDRLPDRFGFDPARESEWRDLLLALRRAVDTELTPRQREVFVAVALNGVPADALAMKLGSNRNALYKMMFDARRKLRAALVANGYLDDAESRRS